MFHFLNTFNKNNIFFRPLIIIYEQKTIKLTGRKNKVLKSLQDNGYKTFEFGGDVIALYFE